MRPRPSPFKENQFCPAWREARLSVRPGVTGLWQVSGRNNVSYDERVRLDVEYRTRPSLRADVSIVGRTVAQLLLWWDNGAY